MGQLLSNLPTGSLVKLNENGQAKKFIKLDVDHYGTGSGVTMLREKTFAPECFSGTYSTLNNRYMGCNLDNFCDGIWPLKLDPEVRECLVPVPIVVAEGGGVATLHTLYRKGFALSCTEVGVAGWQTEGRLFSYFSDNNKRIAHLEDTTTAVFWGLRSPYSNTDYAYYINTGGAVYDFNVYNATFAPRPAFNLKSSIVVSSAKDADGCYTLESVPVAGGGAYVKQNGVWVRAV